MTTTFPPTVDISAESDAPAALERLLQEISAAAGAPSIRLQCISPNAETLSAQWSIVSGDPHVVAATALGCLTEAEHPARAILTAGGFHLSIRPSEAGFTVTITNTGEDGPEPETTETAPLREPGLSSGVPAKVLASSAAPASTARSLPSDDDAPLVLEDGHIGQFRNEVRAHTGDEVPDDDRMVEARGQ